MAFSWGEGIAGCVSTQMQLISISAQPPSVFKKWYQSLSVTNPKIVKQAFTGLNKSFVRILARTQELLTTVVAEDSLLFKQKIYFYWQKIEPSFYLKGNKQKNVINK